MINVKYIIPIVIILWNFNQGNQLITKISGSDNCSHNNLQYAGEANKTNKNKTK